MALISFMVGMGLISSMLACHRDFRMVGDDPRDRQGWGRDTGRMRDPDFPAGGAGMFLDRREAGRLLASVLARRVPPAGVVVLGLPRGGVPVAREVADALGAPLDVLVVRKLGAPGQPELAVGAIGEEGVRVLNGELVAALGLTQGIIDRISATEAHELARRVALYRGGRPPLDVAGRTVIVVDDGIATGATMRAGVQVVRARGGREIIAAAPVGARDSVDSLRGDADDVAVLQTPPFFGSVGEYYENFPQTGDEEVRRILAGPRGRGDA